MRGFSGAHGEQALPGGSEALDFRAASESFVSVRKLKRADLETLRLMVRVKDTLELDFYRCPYTKLFV